MTTLYHVEPCGLGTSDVESLSSYLLRLAQVHQCSVGILLRTTGARLGGFPSEAIASVQHAEIGALIRPNYATSIAVSILAKATGYPLFTFRSMTMLALDASMARSANSYEGNIRWCSACIREQRKSRNPVYFKLIWMFEGMDVCLTHRCKLQDFCRSCFRTQCSVGRRHVIGECAYCGEDLASRIEPTERTDSHFKEILDLVDFVATNPEVDFPKGGYITALKKLQDEAFRLRLETPFLEAIDHQPLEGITPTLRHAIASSQRLHVPIVNLLLGSIDGTNMDLLPTSPIKECHVLPGHRAPWRDKRLVEKQVWSYFESFSDGAHPPLAQIAKHVGLSVGGLRYLLPQFSKHVVEVRTRERVALHLMTMRTLRCRVRAAIHAQVKAGHIPIGRKRILNELIKERHWSKNKIRDEIDRALDAMHLATVCARTRCSAINDARGGSGEPCRCRDEVSMAPYCLTPH